jgi:hypothetical protein
MWRITNFGREEKICEPMGEVLSPERSELNESFCFLKRRKKTKVEEERRRKGGGETQ